jgi:hypothetical protein
MCGCAVWRNRQPIYVPHGDQINVFLISDMVSGPTVTECYCEIIYVLVIKVRLKLGYK